MMMYLIEPLFDVAYLGIIIALGLRLLLMLIGLLLVIWTWNYRYKEGLKNTSILIFASFVFYIPVVLGARFIPALGALMIPKTVAYILLVVTGFRYFIKEFKIENILKDSAVFLFMGLSGGVFYREFTKAFNWKSFTALSVVHVHLITLGFIGLIVIYLLMQNETNNVYEIKIPIKTYIIGIAWTVSAFMVRGIYDITSPVTKLFPDEALSGFAGIGHIILGIGMVWIMLNIIKNKSEYWSKNNE